MPEPKTSVHVKRGIWLHPAGTRFKSCNHKQCWALYFNNTFQADKRSKGLHMPTVTILYFECVGPGKMIFIPLLLKTKTTDLFAHSSNKLCIFKSSLRTVSKNTHITSVSHNRPDLPVSPWQLKRAESPWQRRLPCKYLVTSLTVISGLVGTVHWTRESVWSSGTVTDRRGDGDMLDRSKDCAGSWWMFLSMWIAQERSDR